MSNGNSETNVPRFTIRRMSAEEAERSRRQQRQFQEESPEPELPRAQQVEPLVEPQAAEQIEDEVLLLPEHETEPERETSTPQLPTMTGACFRSAGAVLAFLGTALGTGLIDEALVRHSNDDRWWTEVPVIDTRLAPLVWTSGGRPYRFHNDQWQMLGLTGEAPDNETPVLIDVQKWPVIELSYLLARTRMKPGHFRSLKSVDVLAPGALGRWVLNHAVALGLEVTIRAVHCSPLEGDEKTGNGALLFRITSRARDMEVPIAFVYSLTRLPYVIVADSIGIERLLVDVRNRSPLPVNILENMVPRDQVWVLGPRETGCWRLSAIGEVMDGTLLLEVPEFPIENLTIPGGAIRPQAIPVQLKPGLGDKAHTDAVLVGDMELEWLRSFLPTRNPTDLYFLIPGEGHHILLAPGGLPGIGVPFGIPLVHTGLMGLYMESRMEFSPPMPDSARIERFQLDEDSIVVVTQKGAYRFLTGNMLPAWVLWVGPAPKIQEGLSERSKEFLARISTMLIPEEVKHFKEPRQKERKQVSREERVTLLEQAQKEELKGNFLKAAEMMEAAGHPGPAGRLYERAAMQR